MEPAIKMEMINEIWKAKYSRDLTTEEAWLWADVIKMMFENADRNINKYYEIMETQGKEVADNWVKGLAG